ncbi:MAG: hypothetical protein M1541_10270 [Acidobacteria bacterium]|nr:hypothetical protein [Acidobacteriota bacterium]
MKRSAHFYDVVEDGSDDIDRGDTAGGRIEVEDALPAIEIPLARGVERRQHVLDVIAVELDVLRPPRIRTRSPSCVRQVVPLSSGVRTSGRLRLYVPARMTISTGAFRSFVFRARAASRARSKAAEASLEGLT